MTFWIQMTPHGPILQSGCGERQSLLLTHMYSNQKKSACTALLHPYDSLSRKALACRDSGSYRACGRSKLLAIKSGHPGFQPQSIGDGKEYQRWRRRYPLRPCGRLIPSWEMTCLREWPFCRWFPMIFWTSNFPIVPIGESC